MWTALLLGSFMEIQGSFGQRALVHGQEHQARVELVLCDCQSCGRCMASWSTLNAARHSGNFPVFMWYKLSKVEDARLDRWISAGHAMPV